MIKILFVCSAGGFGGASQSLYEAIRSLCGSVILPHFVTKRGEASKLYGKLTDEIVEAARFSKFDHSRASHYRGIRWLVLLRELAAVPSTLLATHRAINLWASVDIVHVNDITDILTGIILKQRLKAKLVVHVRCMQIKDDRSLRGRLLKNLLERHADAIIPIDGTVADTLPKLPQISVIHNSFDGEARDKTAGHGKDGFAWNQPSSFKVGFLGNFFLSKGVLELVEAARICRDQGIEIEYMMIGGTPTSKPSAKWRLLNLFALAQDQTPEFEKRLQRYALNADFHIIPRTRDVGRYLKQIDVIVFPSHLNACGRSVFEAAYYSKPAIVAVDDPKPDTLVQGKTGIAIPSPKPGLLADALLKLADDRSLVAEMGANARHLWEKNFAPKENAKKLSNLYESLLLDR